IHNVMEGNYVHDSPTNNAHVVLAQDEGSCGSHSLIFRFNRALHIGSYGIFDQAGGDWGGESYNKTYSDVGGDSGCAECIWANSHHGAVLNNLYYNPIGSVSSSGLYCVRNDGSLTGFRGGSNLAFSSKGQSWSGSSVNSCYRVLVDPGNIVQQDPLLFDPNADLHLRTGSPAIAAGTYWATATAAGTNSTALVVGDADFFQDGYGIPGVQADWIRVGSFVTVQIASVNYSTNTLNLATPVSWVSGAQIFLYKDSNGNVVLNGTKPDIGALQHPGGTPPAPPAGLVAAPH